MAISKITAKGIADNAVTSAKLAPGSVTVNDIADGEIGFNKLSQVDLSIAPEVLEIQVDAPAAGQNTAWLWTWEQSTLPYARRTITNSPEISVPLYRQGTYTLNNYAAYSLHGSMTQTHTLYFKWIDGAGTDNLVSWATSTGPVSDTHPDINGGAATQVQRINISVPATVTPPALTPPSVSYSVTNNGTGAYTFSGSASGDNPNIGPFYRGGTYTINITATGHPFYFTTDNGTNFSAGTYFGEYTSGVTGSRTDNGTITFTVPNDAPATLYYQCGNHGVMRGAITVKDLAVETNVNGNYVIYAQHTQEGHKTPVEIRPIPSLVNQMCLVYDANSGKFVPQDLATYVENTPSFENKIREVAGTAELVVEDGSAVIAKVNVYDDSTYLPLVGNNPGDQAFATDTDILYIWDGSAWQQAGAANTDDLAEGTTNLFYTDARVGTYLSAQGYDTATNIVASITDSAPATLDTLNELAAALGDDPNFATTITNSIATKWTQDNTKISNWDTAYGWGDHSLAGYITSADGGNATTLDGLDSSQFLRSDQNDTFNGTLTVSGNIALSGNIDSSGTGYFRLPTGTTAQRPGSPVAGYTRYNTDLLTLEFYNGSNWVGTNLIPTINSVSGEIYNTVNTTLTFSVNNATDTVDVDFSSPSGLITSATDISVSTGIFSVSVPSAVYNQSAGTVITMIVKNQDGTPSSNSVSKTVIGVPSGGNISTANGYRVHRFESSATFTVPSGFSRSMEYAIVAGGGGGGYGNVNEGGGGGGAGGMITGTTTPGQGSYSIVVGAGGTKTNSTSNGNNGGNSSAFSVTSLGGGGGGYCSAASGNNGGSGGGGSGCGADKPGGSGTSGQGNAGGKGAWTGGGGQGTNGNGGGGGGKTAAGTYGQTRADSTQGGEGAGQNLNWVNGSNVEYARGGLGGAGKSNILPPDVAGGTGRGGIGGSDNIGGNGGSGVVLIRYQL